MSIPAAAVTDRLACLCLVFGLAICTAPAQVQPATVHHVSGYSPVNGPGRELSADRPAEAGVPARKAAIADNSSTTPWQLLATLPGATVHDLSFANPQAGFAASENGQVWKTSDGGATWTEVLNLGFPYEWYGVHALDANNVLISGFYD